MHPIDYFRAGSEGLLPDDYTVHYETWDPSTGVYGNENWSETITVSDYGYADFPVDLDVVEPGGRDGDPGKWEFVFRAPNARGYQLRIYRNNRLWRELENVFLPYSEEGSDEEGTLIPLNQLESVLVDIDRAGDYTAEVRGFNPLDENGGDVRADTPGPRWSQFPDFTVVGDDPNDVSDPDETEVFPDGQVFVAPSGGIEITLQWKPIPEAVEYRLYLGGASAAPIFDGRVVEGTTSFRVTVPLGSYVWQTVGINQNGEGTWSKPFTFDVVRDQTAPIIRKVYLGGDRGNDLVIEYAPDSALASRVDIQHYQTDGSDGWRVFSNVSVSHDPRASQGYLSVTGARCVLGDYLLLKAYAGNGKSTDYRVFVIGDGMQQVEVE
jgi:hypothetical protein